MKTLFIKEKNYKKTDDSIVDTFLLYRYLIKKDNNTTTIAESNGIKYEQ